MFSHYAYMSESGSYELNQEENGSNYFIVTFILIESEKYDDLKEEMKWLMLGLEEGHRGDRSLENILPKLADLPFSIYSFVFHKEKLRKEAGFGNQEAFFTYMNKEIYDNLFDDQKDLQLQFFKETTDFTKDFISYVEDRHQPDLFDRSVYSFVEQEKESFMSLANLIGEVLEEKYHLNRKNTWFDELSSRVVRIKLLPDFDLEHLFKHEESLDQTIAKYAISEAEAYIKKYEKSSVQTYQDRVNFLKFLLTQLSIRPTEYIFSQEIINNIGQFSEDPISKEHLMRDITGPLRDADLLISSTSKGYKIPVNTADLYDYVNFSSSMALPMLRRIEKSREIILRETEGEIDILNEEEFHELKQFLNEK